MTSLRSLLGLSLVLALVSCGSDSSGDVTVMRGTELAPSDMTGESGEAARYLSEAQSVLFVSDAMFSGSCAPTASAEQDDDGTVRLTIENSDEDTCTDDANPYTFLITDVPERPSRLVVAAEDSGEPIEIDLSQATSRP